MMRTLLAATTAVALAISPALAQDTAPDDDPRASFARAAVSGNQFEMASSELALNKSQDDAVRSFAQKMLDDTRAQQTKLAAELKAKADADLAEMRLRATADIEAAKKAALAEIYESSVSLATSMASKILRREISAQDQRQLVEESLAELHASRN